MQIELTRGLVATVDDVDADWVLQHNWQAQRSARTWYAKTLIDGRTVKLHRAIAERAGLPLDGLHVDHVNGDGLDNRRANLRVATRAQNGRNQTRKARGNGSRFKGVCWDARGGRWYACIIVDGRHVNLGRYDSEEAAAAAYDAAARQLFGVWAATGVVAENDNAGAAEPVRITPRKSQRTSSRYLRTSLHAASGKWSAQAKGRDGRLVHVPGLSDSAEEMALFGDLLARHLRGDECRLNFPDVVSALPPVFEITGERIEAAVATVRQWGPWRE